MNYDLCVSHCSRAIRLRLQVSAANLKLASGIRSRQPFNSRSLALIAQKAANVAMPMGEQSLHHVHAQKSASTGYQDLHGRTSG
jgi:hypothetical protein